MNFGWARPHDAVDIGAAYGAPVVTTCPGTVFMNYGTIRAVIRRTGPAPARAPTMGLRAGLRPGGVRHLLRPPESGAGGPGQRIETGMQLGAVFHRGERVGSRTCTFKSGDRTPAIRPPAGAGRSHGPVAGVEERGRLASADTVSDPAQNRIDRRRVGVSDKTGARRPSPSSRPLAAADAGWWRWREPTPVDTASCWFGPGKAWRADRRGRSAARW